jgi:REP element-mobilizing transposase RayT
MGKRVRKTSRSSTAAHGDLHRFEHWLADNQVYFITARCRDKFSAFASDAAKDVFWRQFDKYTNEFGYVPWVTSLVDNHCHTIGYLKIGDKLPTMMQRLHGSVAKLVNDLLPARHLPFWRDAEGKGYFDGCIRDEKQARLAYQYTLTQAVRHGIVRDWRMYLHTRVNVELESAIRRSHELKAFLEGVPYKRYQKPR